MNRTDVQDNETANFVSLSLFMRTNEKSKNDNAPSIGLSGILLSVRTNIIKL